MLAMASVEALASLSVESLVFSHGDLGGHNVFWDGGRVCGILDWDLASESGSSTDLTSLGVWHGWEKLSRSASADQVRWALIRRNTYRHQQVGFLIAAQGPESEISAATGKAFLWIRENLS